MTESNNSTPADITNTPPRHWTTLDTTCILEMKPWFKVLKDKIELPSSAIIDDFYRFELPDYAIICAVDSYGRLLLESMYKQCKGRIILTCPAGGIEPSESPLMAAKRELLEETGYFSDTWIDLGSFMVDGTRGLCHANMFIAKDIKKIAAPAENEMEECETLLLDWTQIEQRVDNGEICLLPDIALIYRAKSRYPNLFKSQ